MDISLALCVAVFIVGIVLYFIASAPKVVETGRIMFAAGLLATLLRLFGHVALHIGS